MEGDPVGICIAPSQVSPLVLEVSSDSDEASRAALGQLDTAQLHIHFVRPVLGDRFEVLGRLVRAGRSLVFATADLHDQSGQLCARCDGIVAVAKQAVAEAEEQIAL